MVFLHNCRFLLLLLVLGLPALLAPAISSAQYFGRNKVNYENFDFHVLSTEHFNLHFYPPENLAAHDAARMAERWYDRLSRTFNHEFKKPMPLILYSNHADFQQTNVIGGFIGEGTGGVTEPIRQRVVMPMTGDYAGTDHVLGHEIVHVFQFDIAFAMEDTLPFKLNFLPLWLVEGMAEYLSVGREDPHTAMWLRDAVLQEEFPTIKELTTDPKFFPYRYGQALWAFVGGTWGDEVIADIFRASGRRGIEYGFAKVLGVSTDSLSTMWADAVRKAYLPAMKGRAKPGKTGKRILAQDIDAGDVNLSPVLSPDGSKVAFLSERDLFSIDVFVADAKTGQVQKKLVSSATNSHFDALRFIDSAGTWSPDGKRFALVVFAKGNNELVILDSSSGKIRKRFAPKKVGAISNPAWSPDGRYIAFSGSSQGQSDLYLLDTSDGSVTRLSEDRHADLEPAWSPDGSMLAFVTDRGPETHFESLTYGPMIIGVLDLESRDIRLLAPFPGHKHINPQFSPDGRSLFFISDNEGFSDVYRLDLDTEEVFQVTRLATGVSGITALSPAMSVASATGDLMFSAFEEGKYIVYRLTSEEARGTRMEPEAQPEPGPFEEPEPRTGEPLAGVQESEEPEPDAGTEIEAPVDEPARANSTTPEGNAKTLEPPPDPAYVAHADALAPGWTLGISDTLMLHGALPDTSGFSFLPAELRAGRLPPAEDQGKVLVSDYLADPLAGLPPNSDYPVEDYHPKLQLDYVGAFSVGGITVDRFGTSIGGGATAFFSDMLNNHTVGAGIQANGSFKDIGAQTFYLNRTKRWNWGGVIGHIPYLDAYSTISSRGDTLVIRDYRDRVFLERASLFAAYPFSQTRRVEVSAGFTLYHFDEEVEEQRILPSGRITEPVTTDLDSRDPIKLFQSSLALVGDNTFFGFTSPISGARYRLEVEPAFGTINYYTVLADYRRYLLLRPFTIAGRGFHLARYGPDGEDERLTPLFLGYGTLVRGYSYGSFDPVFECTRSLGDGDCVEFDRLLGSRLAVANFELRYPFLGTAGYGLINFPYLPTELALFLDAGVAWNSDDPPEWRWDTNTIERVPVMSAGGTARVNILGAMVLEFFLAYPFHRPEKHHVFGLQIVPGW